MNTYWEDPSDYPNAKAELEARLEGVCDQRDKLEAEVARLIPEHDQLTYELGQAKEEASRAWRDVARLQKELADTYGEVDRLKTEMVEVVDWARDRQDVVDGDDGQPQPDDIMKIANMLEEALYGPGGY